MKALDILNHDECDLNKNNTNDICIDQNIIKESIDQANSNIISFYNILGSEQEDLTFSERVDELIDPDMNIDKVIEMIQDAKSLSYTKSEAYDLIEKFRENFKKEYLIIKKIN